MAQSPEKFGEPAAGSDYLKGWDALGALIAQGHSFSGRERNCAFLNLGTATAISGGKPQGANVPSFACASGALNLDQIDDSRAVIPVDWDGDGDLDLWYANRTAPRLRFLRNDMPGGSHWIALRFEGRSCNRDAIGARAELTLGSLDGTKRTLWRRLRAGDGFLSQTPKSLHFGFRRDEKIERLVVRWPAPGTAEENVPNVRPDQTYRITEGKGAQSITVKASALPATVRAAALPDEPEQARIVLVNRMPVPELGYVDFQGKAQTIGGAALAQPTLLLLWASWCAPCLREMSELAAQAAELKAKRVRVLALSVDAASANANADNIADAKRAMGAMQWPFEAGVTSDVTLRALARIESKSLYQERPLPLPTSYLLDLSGRLAVLYHGPVTPQQIAQDSDFAANPPETAEGMQAAAFPFPGRDAKPLFSLTPAAYAQSLREAGYLDDARNELRRQLDRIGGQTAPDAAALSAVWWRLADLEEEAGHMDEALAAYQKSLSLTPEQPSLQLAFAATLWRVKRFGEAETAFTKALALAKDTPAFQNQTGKVWQALGEHGRARKAFAAAVAAAPNDVEALFNLAVARQFTGDSAGAVADYENLLRQNPGLLDAASNLAWVLATAKDGKIRQPSRALELAAQVNQSANGQSPAGLDNLAAAQAAAADFTGAIATAESAVSLAIASGEMSLAADIKKHLASYRDHRPWIE